MSGTPAEERAPVSVVLPTYRRHDVLLETVESLLRLRPAPDEIVVVDQTPRHPRGVEERLARLDAEGCIRWIRRGPPSIPLAMNRGLAAARNDRVLFLDDDIHPLEGLVAHHAARRHERDVLLAGHVFQPWNVRSVAGVETRDPPPPPGPRTEFMGGNFSVDRDTALALGGFDPAFVRVAYRFEAEFADRFLRGGGRIWFDPQAAIDHRKVPSGGTRAYGDHLRTASPAHAVGEYYFLLKARPRGWVGTFLRRPVRAVSTRHHLRRPWWILPSLVAETLGMAWAAALLAKSSRRAHAPRRGVA